jgi:hypothetical protein
MMPRPQPPTGQPLASAAIPAPEVNKAEPAAQWTVVQQTPVTRWQARSPEAGRDLHRFLADHSEFAATGVKGAMPLATLVGYGAGR